ncbi:cytochrome P450 [Novosphingobium lentum]|uniref:cytochrome P450 n=1 Tax=Novosphingobium lentum TaxID=145287 RepID=UPI00082BCA67|nr:cytochrome P450 [Novosphingobium lentum]
MSATSVIPAFRRDFWSDDVILDPYPVYRELRDLGPAVWLEANGCWALTQYATVRAALLDPQTYSSASGCMMNAPMNTATKGIMLCSDDPEHLAMRRLFAKPLQPKALIEHRRRFEDLAKERILELLARESFDAVADLAHFLPLAVVTELVGLDQYGRDNMLDWAMGIFNAFGPEDNARTNDGIALAGGVIDYVLNKLDRANMVAGGWGEALFLAADEGRISEQTARMMLIDYLSPALDTTINATSAAIELFAAHPEQWSRLRADPSLIPSAINEVIRLESPIRAFSRLVTRDHAIGDAQLHKGDRALMLYACANRDPRHYPDPDRFDIARGAGDHLGFGQGTHVCAGMHLAKLEISILFEAMLPVVAGFRTGKSERRAHNTLRGLYSLETTMVGAEEL